MQPHTEEFLNLLLWGADKFARPTFTNITGSYEEWAYGKGLSRQAALLEKKRLVERDPTSPDDRTYRLTAQGRIQVLGGRDPEACWSRDWDGRWRLVLFDLPTTRNTDRARLRRHLSSRGFGFLQDSVWISPDSLDEERKLLEGGKVNVESLLLLVARPCAGESDAEIVAGAWDFERINRQYVRHLKILDQLPDTPLHTESARRALQRWAGLERAVWREAVTLDPLLPERLLPPDYVGRRAWRKRMDTLRDAGRLMRQFEIENN